MLTPERWQKVRDVLGEAMELAPEKRSRFLDLACSSDPALRSEVQALLSSDDQARSSFLESPAVTPSTLMPGTMVGDYEILSQIGSGGMGVVYRARDTRLGRPVAIKVLLAHLSSDASRLKRFEQEAQSAAALNHPNILAVYQLGSYEGAPYLVSELLEGQTLREQLKQGPLSQESALDSAQQIAEGMSAAHERRIVHRDLKPENLFVTNEGRVKILDFGLAKLTEADSGSAETVASVGVQTHPGLIAGTVGYMSPEQVRGEKLDTRTDLFSFGVVLYEMVTGRRPFEGDTSGVTFEAILNRQPTPPTKLNTKVTPGLENIITKALEKDREVRYQSATELRADLKRLKRDSSSGKVPRESGDVSASSAAAAEPAAERRTGSATAVQTTPRLLWKKYAVLVAGVALLATAFAAYHFWPRSNPPSGPAKITQISQWNKPMNHARLSPDGRTVAFVSPVGGIVQVFLMLTSGGEPLQLTNGEGDKYVYGFSPDGREVYYGMSLGRNEVWAMPALGGAPRRVVSAWSMIPSPDGIYIFYMRSDGYGIFRAEKSGLNEELVYNFEGTGLIFFPLLVFPGGTDLLAAGVPTNNDPKFHLYSINASHHGSVDLGEVSGNFDFVWGEPGKTVLFSRPVNGLTNIWSYSLKDRTLTQITFGTGSDSSPMPDPDGKGIYYVNGKSSGFLTAYHVHSKESTDIVPEDSTQPAISPDGKRVMYITLPAPNRNELWVSDIDGGNKIKIAAGGSLGTGYWAPDNFHLSFAESEAGAGYKAYVVAADGSGLRQLPPMGGGTFNPVWSPDQKSIYANVQEKVATAAPILTVWKWSLAGSNPEKVANDCALITDIDPGGRYLLGPAVAGARTGIYEVSLSERKCIPLLPGASTFSVAFARDGKSFLYAVASRGEVTIYRQLWRDGKLTGAPQVALKVPFAFPLQYDGNAYDFSRDLSTIVYARPTSHADLYLLNPK
jgi:eukaryotic-like serine/threonine-protein kinase